MRRKSKLPYDATKINFELLHLVADEIDDDNAQLYIGSCASHIKPECIELIKRAAARGDQISRDNLLLLLQELSDDEGETSLIAHSWEFETAHIQEWATKLIKFKELPDF